MTLQVYDLPETVRESDVEKLSFAVQPAEGLSCRLTRAAT